MFKKSINTKPIYVGFCILELSKLLMYQFHYDYVLKTFNDVNCYLQTLVKFRKFTDSLVYEIRGGNVYGQCFRDKHLFDFSGILKILFILMIVIKKCWVR